MENEVFSKWLVKHRNKSFLKTKENEREKPIWNSSKFLKQENAMSYMQNDTILCAMCSANELKSRIFQLHFDLQPSGNLTPKYFVRSRKREQSLLLWKCFVDAIRPVLLQIIYYKCVSVRSSSLSKTFSVALQFILRMCLCCLLSLLEWRHFSLISYNVTSFLLPNRRIMKWQHNINNNNNKKWSNCTFAFQFLFVHPMESRSVINMVLDFGPLYLQWIAAFEL